MKIATNNSRALTRVFQVTLSTLIILLCCTGCSSNQKKEEPVPTFDWSNNRVPLPTTDSLENGKSYLSVYSQIYSYTEQTSIDLTATISMRNTSTTDSIYLIKADYYNTRGDATRSYMQEIIGLQPMETLEIVIAEFDKKGGTGANFVFEWAAKPNASEPLFEAVMISSYGQLGLSFTTVGKRIE